MTVGNAYGSYDPSTGLALLGSAIRYYLNDHTSWLSGAGTHNVYKATLDHVETVGNTVRFVLTPSPDGGIYQQTDYNAGDHSAQGTLTAAGPLVLEAEIGSTTATLRGLALVDSNEETWYGHPRFNYYSALPGSIVPFTLRYTLFTGTWSSTTLDEIFQFSNSGLVDFKHPVSSPRLLSVEIVGPAQVPDNSTVQYTAIAHYEGGVARDVTAPATWAVSPPELASISVGQLRTYQLTTPQAELTLLAAYQFGAVINVASFTALCRADLLIIPSNDWPTYQANANHDGYVPVTVKPAIFEPVWSNQLVSNTPLNPVTAADGRVFSSVWTYFGSGNSFFALDARDGHVMWSKAYTSFSVNPPAAAYGNVYIQTGNHANDTWLRAYDAATGNPIFQSPHAAQWERYFSPTPFDGKIYIDGGYYGGMYGFDALSGTESWFLNLPQYDGWTPAVDDEYVYAYVGEYNPGLYVAHRGDGSEAFMIPDPDFEWNGWSMNLAPVLGGEQDVFAIHDDRLIRFDLGNQNISWQLDNGFTGQPSVAHGSVYAIQNGDLVVLDQETGTQQWSWGPSSGNLAGAIVVTRHHLFATSEAATFAVDLDSREAVWSYPTTGHLALGNGQLYIADASGLLTAILVVEPLEARAGLDSTLECGSESEAGTPVRLDGSGSTGDALVFHWSAPGVTFDDDSSATPTGYFPVGTHVVTLEVTAAGASSSDEVVIAVHDTRAPRLTVELSPAIVWPPDQREVSVAVNVTAEDSCDANSIFELTRIFITELGLGSASTQSGEDDVEFEVTSTVGYLQFRASRDAHGEGRLVGICFRALDTSGNRSAEVCGSVLVPHDQSGRARLNEGPNSWTLTLYGSPSLDVHTIDGSSIIVRHGNDDLFLGTSAPSLFADTDEDGYMDVVFPLEPENANASASPFDGQLWVRWDAGPHSYLAAVSVGAATAVQDGIPEALAVHMIRNPTPVPARIQYEIPEEGPVRLCIYDVGGREVATLIDGTVPAGRHQAHFEGAATSGTSLYFYRLEWAGKRATGKFLLLK